MNQNIASDLLSLHQDVIMNFNRSMDEAAPLHRLNETVLVELLDGLDEEAFVGVTLYWLSMARLTELAVQCAAHYVKSCEFALMGDLLVNPRQVLIYVKGDRQPILKKRHTPLTEQFRHMGSSRGEVIRWLSRQAIVEVRKNPLLPDLYERLEKSGAMSDRYLKSVDDRLKGVAGFGAYLACGNFRNGTDFEAWLEKTSSEDRRVINRKIRRFDYSFFNTLGDDMGRIALDPGFKSRFLN